MYIKLHRYCVYLRLSPRSSSLFQNHSGWGLETNSYDFGFFQETVRAYEICTSTGEVLIVTKESNPDLFYALPWSHGSLGFLLSVTVEMIQVKPFVKITYIPTYSAKDMVSKLEEYTVKNPTSTFVEATMYTKEKSVIQLGEFTDEAPPERYNEINRFWKPFYYKHVETFLERGEDWEVVPINDFYHRFTRSIFWEIEDMIPFSNHPLYRILWGWMGAPEVNDIAINSDSCCLLFVVCCLLFVVCPPRCLLVVVCWSLFVGRCLSTPLFVGCC